MDRRPWWETRGRGGDIDPTRPARIASSRQRRVRTSGTVPLRAPRRRARLIPRRTRALPLAQRAAVRPRRCHCAWRSRRPTPHYRNARYAASSPMPSERPLGTRPSSSVGRWAGSRFLLPRRKSSPKRPFLPRSHGSATHQHQALSFDCRSTSDVCQRDSQLMAVERLICLSVAWGQFRPSFPGLPFVTGIEQVCRALGGPFGAPASSGSWKEVGGSVFSRCRQPEETLGAGPPGRQAPRARSRSQALGPALAKSGPRGARRA